jgi:glycosyltransferase involved in cell wall biosynthesis
MKKKIIVRGPALSRSGYGEQTRFALRSLRAHEDKFDIYLITTNWGQTGWIVKDDEERRWMDSLLQKTVEAHNNNQNIEFDMSLQITIPNEWEKLAKYNIGYTAGIETTKIAPVWIEKANMMDKIIVVSNHAKYGFDNTSYEATNKQTGEVIKDYRCSTPVEVVNYPVRKTKKTDLELDLAYDFNFLVIAQWSPRKNVENTIKWFVDEFKDDEVGLVLKINYKNNCTMDREASASTIKAMLAETREQRKCKIYLLHGEMTDQEVSALYVDPKIKAFVTLAHGEGYGLPIFEAAYSGLPVIAPSWSGQCDFLYAPVRDKKTKKTKVKPLFANVDYSIKPIQSEAQWEGVLQPDSMWCYPYENSYKRRLREMYKSYSRFKSTAAKLKTYICKNFTEQQQFDEFVNAMNLEQGIDEEVARLFSEVQAGA